MNSKVARTDGDTLNPMMRGEWQQQVVVGSNAYLLGFDMASYFDNTGMPCPSGLHAGDRVQAFHEYEIEGGAVGLVAVRFQVVFQTGAQAMQMEVSNAPAAYVPTRYPQTVRLVVATPEFTIGAADLAATAIVHNARAYIGSTDASFTIRHGRRALRKVA